MATNLQRKTTIDPQSGIPLTPDTFDPAAPNIQVNQSATGSSAGIIAVIVVVLIGAILAYNHGWFNGTTAPDVVQNNTTTTIEPAPSETTTTEPSGSGQTGTTGTATSDQ